MGSFNDPVFQRQDLEPVPSPGAQALMLCYVP